MDSTGRRQHTSDSQHFRHSLYVKALCYIDACMSTISIAFHNTDIDVSKQEALIALMQDHREISFIQGQEEEGEPAHPQETLSPHST